MVTGLYWHPDCLLHVMPTGHPECVDRLNVISAVLEGEAFASLKRFEAPQATWEQIGLVHERHYIEAVLRNSPEKDHYMLDADTYLSPGSVAAARRAAGAVCDAVDRVMEGEISNAFCAVRPPGHHAEPDRAMGFCLFNNVAIGALHARTAHFQHRVAIVDFDVHHGNGTQTVTARQKGLFYASSHQSPLYPGTGHLHDRGEGVIVNAPLAAGSGSKAFRHAYEERILPALRAFAPDFLLISSGFDGHALDPLAGLTLEEEDYVWVTEKLKQVAEEYCHGRLVSCLEGGYNLSVLGESVAAHVAALMR